MSPTTEEISKVARSLVGVPYLHQGRSDKGMDCVGLIVLVCAKLGLGNKSADSSNYRRAGNGILLERQLTRGGFRRLQQNDPKPGHLLTFRIGGSARVQHVGIFLDRERLVHVYQEAGKVVEHTLNSKWKQLIQGVWEFPERK